jgi:molybdenum cofactor cytidylyltransferase
MIFEHVPLAVARGGILAHNLQVQDRVLRKGALVDAAAIDLLRKAGHIAVTIARLEPGDVPEGEAASYLGTLLLGTGLRCSADVHGRVNLFAEIRGLFRLDAEKVEMLNRIDEAVTLATLHDRSAVEAGDMIATLKIIPFAVSSDSMAKAESLIRQPGLILQVKPFQPLAVGLVLTKLPQLKDSVIAATIAVTAARVAAHGGTLLPPMQTMHEPDPLADAIAKQLSAGAELILISGASAVTDRKDIAPQAIVQAGGSITHFGMPVDPGNLICFGRIGATPAIVLPGCARSPALNGIDWILDRLFASEPIGPEEVAGMGVGGLLKEIDNRPVPRTATAPAAFGKRPKSIPRIAALILAAGHSTRMGSNKLLAELPDGRPMIAHTVERAMASACSPLIIVTGHQDDAIRNALTDLPVRFVHAADYAQGISASLNAGITELSADIGAALICLGDMPLIEAHVFRQLISAFNPVEGREIILPRFDGQRGNPVLWGKRFFPELLRLTGDTGARQILPHHMEFVAEIDVETDTVLRDFDTPEMLKTLMA